MTVRVLAGENMREARKKMRKMENTNLQKYQLLQQLLPRNGRVYQRRVYPLTLYAITLPFIC
jgi:hypothetical protein